MEDDVPWTGTDIFKIYSVSGREPKGRDNFLEKGGRGSDKNRGEAEGPSKGRRALCG